MQPKNHTWTRRSDHEQELQKSCWSVTWHCNQYVHTECNRKKSCVAPPLTDTAGVEHQIIIGVVSHKDIREGPVSEMQYNLSGKGGPST